MEELTDSITYCLAKDMLPLHNVEKKGFRLLVERLDPQYDLPSSKYFSNTAIPGLFEKTKENVFANLQIAEYVSATMDMWSSELYLCFTLHYIGKEWNLQSTFAVSFPPTADNLAEALKETLTEWQHDDNKLMYNHRQWE